MRPVWSDVVDLGMLSPSAHASLTALTKAPGAVAGIKKQACINRKCLLMVPMDEDGEKLARKRAKQRAVPPPMPHMALLMPCDTAPLLSILPIDLPSSPVPTHLSANTTTSPRSCMSTPTSSLERLVDERRESAAMTQALCEESLFALALDEEKGHSLSSAMLFATIQTPVSSPCHSSAAAEQTQQSSLPSAALTSTRCKRRVEIDIDEEEDTRELNAAFAAHIAAKLELDAPPPAQPPLDELHEEFLLLNAEHRRATECVLAF